MKFKNGIPGIYIYSVCIYRTSLLTAHIQYAVHYAATYTGGADRSARGPDGP